MAAGACFYDFPHVVTKGHNNNLWQSAAPIVSFIVIKNGAVCGHGPSLFVCALVGGRDGKKDVSVCGRGGVSRARSERKRVSLRLTIIYSYLHRNIKMELKIEIVFFCPKLH